jgi:SWI/SNF-related matrix-associated actin-dependent regulator 1 of chromatin subfamily A
MMIVNKFGKYCAVCGKWVNPGEGFARKESSGWFTYCNFHKPNEKVHTPVAATPAPAPTPAAPKVYTTPKFSRRELTADGMVYIEPWTNDAIVLALLHTFPGRQWHPEGKFWTVSTEPKDHDEVLKVAHKLNLTIHPDWLRGKGLSAVERAEEHGLYPYQLTGVEWLTRQERAILGDEMGLGKTLEAIMSLEAGEPVLVVCPANVKYNWRKEFAMWRPEYRVEVLAHRGTFRWPNKGEAVVLNYDLLPPWLLPKGDKKTVTWAFDDMAAARQTVLICDEAHAVKNSKTARHKKIKQLVYKVKKTWFLTGTPLTNKVSDLLGLLFCLNRFNDTFGTIENFVRLFNVRRNHFGYEWDTARPSKGVYPILDSVMLRRTRQEVLPQLPDITYQTLFVNDLSDSIRSQLDVLAETYGTTFDVLPKFEEFSKVRKALAKARIPAMMEFVEDCEDQDVPLVVFSAHRDPIDVLEKRPGWGVITGDTAAEKRQEVADRFQRGELLGLGATIQAGGIGINLTRAWMALFVDKDWTPALNAQAERRLLRIGQESDKVNIVEMVSNHPLDIHVQQLLGSKIRLHKETVG